MAIPLSPQELERRRAQSIADQQKAREMVQRPGQTSVKNTPLPQAPKTVSEQFFSGNRDNKTIGSFRNTSVNGYQNTGAPKMSQTAIDAQKRNEEAMKKMAPSAEDFAKMNAGASTVGAQAQAGVTDQKVVGSFNNQTKPPLEFGKNVATPNVGGAVSPTASAGTTPPTAIPTTPSTPTNPTATPTGETGTTGGTGTTGTTGAPTGIQTEGETGVPSTGVAGYDNVLNNAGEILDTATQFAIADRDATKQQLKNQLLQTIDGTTIDDIARAEGKVLGSMTFDELQNYIALKGIELDASEIEKIKAGGKAELENIEWSKNAQMAINDMTVRQVERAFNRELDEREQFNISQDMRQRALMGTFGVENLASNAQVLKSLDDGVKAKAELANMFADKLTPLAIQGQSIMREYSQNVAAVHNKMAEIQENKYAEIVSKLNDLANQGITSEKEMRKAVMSEMKDYGKVVSETNDRALKYIQDENKRLFDESKFLIEQQFKEDELDMKNSGILYKNGEPIYDQQGNTIPTLDGMKFISEQDERLTRNSGYIYENGSYKLDSNGQPIKTFDRDKFDQEVFNADRNYLINQSQEDRAIRKEQTDADIRASEATGNYYVDGKPLVGPDGELMTTLQGQKAALDMKSTSLATTKSLVEAGVLPQSAYNQYLSPSDVISNSVYVGRQGPVDLGEKLSEIIKSSPYGNNCVQFVRSLIPDMPTGLWTLADKVNNLLKGPGKLEIPEPGAVLVMSTGEAAGHVAVVSGVDYEKGKVYLAEANWKKGQTGTREMDINDPRIKGYWKSQNVQNGTTAKKGKQLGESTLTMLSDAQYLPTVLTGVEDLINKSGDFGEATYGPFSGTIRSWDPTDTKQQTAIAETTRAAQLIGKFMEGGVLRAEDEKKYTKMLPNISDTKEVAKNKLEGVKKMLQEKYKGYIQTYKDGGYDTTALEKQLASLGGNTDTTTKDNVESLLNLFNR